MALALANYTDLQATALSFMERTGETASSDAAPVWIQLAEARLNRELGPIETDQTFTATVGSRTLDISSLTIVEPLRLWYQPSSNVMEVELEQVPAVNLPRTYVNAPPIAWCMDNQSSILLDAPANDTYALRFRYRGRFSLSSTSTNWLMTQHPDIYLAATLMWGAGYNQDWSNGPVWKAILDEEVPKVRNIYAQRRRGMSRVDPAIVMKGWRSGYNIQSDN